MRIGLFTDSYRPAVNGITFVIDITRRRLEEMGHEVYIFCPAAGVRLKKTEKDEHIIRFRSIPDVFFEDYGLSLFFPARELHKIKKLNLDVIQFFTPGQVGLMGVYAAKKLGTVLVAQHSTDLANYIKHYPGVVPGLLLLALTFPATFRFKGKDVKELLKIYRPRLAMSKWGKDIIESLMAMIYSRCDAVVALSPKSKRQLESWQIEYSYDVQLIPTGVDALPAPTTSQLKQFRATYGIADDDEVVLYVGRLAAEKNLDMLISVIRRALKSRPKARLVYVGDFEYKKTLEEKADRSGVGERITFTGSLPRDYLGVVYASAKLFVFPSRTDTQGLVLHEAAQAGLPIVITDPGISLVVKNNENGFIVRNTVADFTNAVVKILDDETLQKTFGKASKKLASECGELSQTKKLEAIYKNESRPRQPESTS